MGCPNKEKLESGRMVCDFMGVKHPDSVIQCPTDIFNACQEEAYNESLKEHKPNI